MNSDSKPEGSTPAQAQSNCGVIYIATGSRCVAEALRSVQSFKAHNPRIPATLFTDLTKRPAEFDQIFAIENPTYSSFDKVANILRTPYDKTLFLDSDTYIAADLTDVFTLLDNYDFAGAIEISRGYWYRHLTDLPDSFPEINSGVLAFRRSSAVDRLLADWQRCYHDSVAWQKTPGLTDRVWDQPGLRQALYASPDLRLTHLPTEYNAIQFTGIFVWGRAKILHGRNRPEAFASSMNQHAGIARVYLQQIGTYRGWANMNIRELLQFAFRVNAVVAIAIFKEIGSTVYGMFSRTAAPKTSLIAQRSVENFQKQKRPISSSANHSKKWIDPTFQQGLVSIIMPTYNRGQFILAAVESVYRQDYRPIEVVVADDGSTDNTEEKLTEWLAKVAPDSDFSVNYSRKPNGGASSARNWAVERSRGEYILYVDSDDSLLPGTIRRAATLLNGNELPYVYFRVQNSDENLQPKESYIGQPFAGNDADLTDYLWHTMGPVYRRSTVNQVGPWSEELTAVDDWEYGTRVKLMGFEGKFDSNVIGLYRDHQEARLNVYAFSEKYVRNVEKACDLIIQTAKEQDRMSPVFRKKMALRLVVHAVELGMNHHRDDCRRLLDKAQQLLPHSPAFRAGAALLKRFSGRASCSVLWQINTWRMRARA